MAGAQDFLSKDALDPESLSRSLSFAIERYHYQHQLGKYQTRLAEAEKLEALGQLVASVAHELKNPLGILALSTDLLKSEVSLSPRHQAALERADRATTRSTNLINRLLDWTSLATQKRTLMELDLVNEISEIVQDSFADTCTFESQLESCFINLEPTEFQQVVINLTSNAVGASGEEGSVLLTLEPVQEFEKENWLFSSQLNWERDYCVLRIKNSGKQFPPELLPNVFEAFVSGELKARRMGLGLWVASTIASRMQGALAIDTSPREEGGGSALLYSTSVSAKCSSIRLIALLRSRGLGKTVTECFSPTGMTVSQRKIPETTMNLFCSKAPFLSCSRKNSSPVWSGIRRSTKTKSGLIKVRILFGKLSTCSDMDQQLGIASYYSITKGFAEVLLIINEVDTFYWFFIHFTKKIKLGWVRC